MDGSPRDCQRERGNCGSGRRIPLRKLLRELRYKILDIAAVTTQHNPSLRLIKGELPQVTLILRQTEQRPFTLEDADLREYLAGCVPHDEILHDNRRHPAERQRAGLDAASQGRHELAHQ